MKLMLRPRALHAPLSLAAIGLVQVSVGCATNAEPKSPAASCQPAETLIDDGEDNNNQTAVLGGRGGYWYTFVDEAGTTVWPTAGAQGGTFEMSPGGAHGSGFAMHMKGQVAATGTPLYTGMGMNFVDPKGIYDTSAYTGISFYAKKGPGSTGNVRVKLPDNFTDPDGGKCTECFNDMGEDLHLSEEWTLVELPFKRLRQMPGWGRPRRMKVDQASMYGIQFQVNEPGTTYDIWVDDLKFMGCE